jgi:hypothetical protein
MSNRGYILMSRQLLKHPRFKPRGPFSQFEAWYWLIESAAYSLREVPIMMGPRREIITLQPGQLSHSIRFLSRAWRWSPNRVRRFLNDLAMDGSVDTATDTAQTLITLCNWGKYQRPFSEADTPTDTATDTATDTKKKEIKERKKISPSGGEPEGFASWYAIYPKHVDRIDAAKAFARLMKSGAITLEALMAATARYAVKVANTEKRFIKAPSVWINKGSYLDEPEGNGGEPAPAVRDPRSFTDADWQKRLTYFHDADKWLEPWGPKPGDPGCLVPSHLIVTPVSSAQGAA